ncbi:FAD-dependent oxidoreductase [Marivita sp.]|uniref:FAD-dependent oxidoreductase n=1 Tax=Marivita sp. TaxID=2003365 RepID=UPI003A8A4908
MAFISHTPVILPLDRPTGRRPADEIVPIDEVSEIGGKYDWLVVGAGITGLSAAHRLGELVPQDRVLLVDARPVGWGASGRNSGFLLDLTRAERKRYTGKMNWGLTPADAGGTTLRMTSDGRLLIRNHYGFAPNYRASSRDLGKVAEAHREGLDNRFPTLANVPITSTWGGVVSL